MRTIAIKQYLLLGLLLASFLTQILWLNFPQSVVFDEVHFGKFVTAYCCTGEHFFDIHPPHAKLLIAGTAWLGGYQGGFDFENIGQKYPDDIRLVSLRILPALAGALLPLIIFLLLRQFGASYWAAMIGGYAIALDNAVTVHTRVISLDGVLLVATFGALSAFLAAQKRKDYWAPVLFALSGALAGLAVGVKFTGLAALGLLGMMVLVKIVQNMRNKDWINWVIYGLLILLSAIFVYLLGWWMHFNFLPLSGSGDAWLSPTGNFLQDTIATHKSMLGANYNLTATHPYSSSWWEWPIMKEPIFYWQSNGSLIYFIGNPAVWWGGLILFLIAMGRLLMGKWQEISSYMWIPIVGFIISFIPLISVPRALFMYHYLTPLIFLILIGLLWLDKKIDADNEKNINQILSFYGIAFVLIILGFFWMAPITYGIPLSDFMQKVIFIFPNWR